MDVVRIETGGYPMDEVRQDTEGSHDESSSASTPVVDLSLSQSATQEAKGHSHLPLIEKTKNALKTSEKVVKKGINFLTPKSVRKKGTSRFGRRDDSDIPEPQNTDIQVLSHSKQYSYLNELDHFVLNRIFHEEVLWSERRHEGDAFEVIVKVLATTIPPLTPPRANLRETRKSRRYRYESSFVGIIYKRDPRACEMNLLQRGSMVTSLRKCGSRAKYVTIDSDSLISVSGNHDPAEVACVLSTYLPAFACLHHGSLRRKDRFNQDCLRRRTVLITGGQHLEARAAAKLAIYGGAKKVYLLHDDTRKIDESERILALSDDPEVWVPILQFKVDVVLDYSYPKNFGFITNILKESTRFVCNKSNGANQGVLPGLGGDLLLHPTLYTMSLTSVFDYDDMCKSQAGSLEEDLKFLLFLLSRRRIRPYIDRFVGSRDVESLEKCVREEDLKGDIVCEPWRLGENEPDDLPDIKSFETSQKIRAWAD